MKKNTILIIVVILIIVLCIGIAVAVQKNSDEEENNLTEQNTENLEGQSNNTDLSKEEIVKRAFLDDLKKQSENTENGMDMSLSDYRVDNVKIEDNSEITASFGSDVLKSQDGILATVTYSVKPATEESKGSWSAGNGDLEEDWITNKTACVEVDNTSEGYQVVSNGTSW